MWQLFLLAFGALVLTFRLPPLPFDWLGLFTDGRSVYGRLEDRFGPRWAWLTIIALSLVLSGGLALGYHYWQSGGW